MRFPICLVLGFLLAADIRAEDPKPRLDAEGFPLPTEAVRRLGSAKFLAGDVSWAAFSPDNKTLVTFDESTFAANLKIERPGLMAWDTATGRLLWRQQLDLHRSKFAVDARGESLWVVGYTFRNDPNRGNIPTPSQLRIDMSSGKILGERKVTAEYCNCLDIAADGSLFRVEIREDFTAEVYVTDKDGKQTFHCDTEHLGTVRFLKRSSDGKRLYAGMRGLVNPHERESVYLVAFDVAGGKALWKKRLDTLVGIETSADDKCVYALHSRLRQIPRVNVKPMLTTEEYKAAVSEFDSGTGKELRTTEIKSIDSVFIRPDLEGQSRMARHPDGKRLLITHRYGKTTPLDLKSLESGQPEEHNAGIGWFSPDGKYFAGRATGQVIVYDTKTSKPAAASPPPNPPVYFESARGLSWNASGTKLAQRFGPQCIEWDAPTGKETFRGVRPLSISNAYLGYATAQPWGSGATQSPDGRFAAEFKSRNDPEDLRRGEWVFTDTGARITMQEIVGFFEYQFSPDNRTFAAVEKGFKTLKIWNLADGAKPRTIAFPPADAWSTKPRWLNFSPDGSSLAVVTENVSDLGRQPGQVSRFKITVYDSKTLDIVATVIGAPKLHSLHWSRDGRRLAGAGKKGLFDNTGPFLFVAEPGAEGMPMPVTNLDHPAGVIALSPDGRTLAVSTLDDIRLYEVASRKLRHTFKGLKTAASALEFSPDGRYLASDSADGPVLLWDVRGELAKPAKPATFDPLWTTLRDGSAAEAFDAVRWLAAHPELAIPFLKTKFAGEPKPDAAAIAKWIADLGGKDFTAREKADRELRNLGSVGKAALRKALLGEVNQEFRLRADAILETALEPDRLRAIRAIEVLTWIGSVDAKKLIAAWADGEIAAPLTVEAKRAL